MNGIKITGFDILEKLGQGGMASVWRARQVSLDRIVAIKILSTRFAEAPTDIKRFQAEAQAAARLKHQSIVQVYDANAESGLYYFVMEYVGGYTVGDWVRRKGALPEKEVLVVADCVADALQYAWESQHIIHCDIKPDNIIIDTDGTVKVADLGLARTISAMKAAETADEVMGTPAYMAPEQARGDANLDCRVDIYSLGAMLYHLLTAKLLFQGHDDEKVMQMQITDRVEDPFDTNPALSKPVCWLMEKMLAKDREHRYKDWKTVRSDIARVQKGLLPAHKLADKAVSTIRRGRNRLKIDTRGHRASAGTEAQEEQRPSRLLVILAILGVLIFGVFLVFKAMEKQEPPPAVPRQAPPLVEAPVQPPPLEAPARTADEAAKEMYDFATKWEKQNPGKYDTAIQKYQRVLTETRGTKYSLMAEEQINRLKAAKIERVANVTTQLQTQCDALLADGKNPIDVAQAYETYSGPMADETREFRKTKAVALRNRFAFAEQEKQKAEKRKDAKYAALLDGIAAKLVDEGVPQALVATDGGLADKEMTSKIPELGAIRRILIDAAAVDDRILESFRAQKGTEITVQTAAGDKRFVVSDAKDATVFGTQQMNVGGGVVSSECSVALKDLAPREKLSRMGADTQPEVALVKGLMACQSKAFDYARKYLGSLPPTLSERLVKRVDQAEKDGANQEAEKALARVVQTMGVAVGAYDAQAWLGAIRIKNLPANREAVADYRKKHGETDFARKAEPVLALLEKGAAASVKEEAVKPPDGQADTKTPRDPEAVRNDIIRRLIDKNPALDAGAIKVETGEDGNAINLEVVSSELVDISPVAELKKLRKLACTTVPPGNQWSDSPLCRLKDISCLTGLPLESLYLGLTAVQDLSPLRGMNLRFLDVRFSQVSDVAPLKDMPLEFLNLRGTRVKDTTALKGLRLKNLDVGRSAITDLRFLAGMPLEWLGLEGMPVKDLNVVKGLSLRTLILTRTQVASLGILKGMPLKELMLTETAVKDMAPLRGMNTLESLDLARTSVSDLTPLQGIPLKRLDLHGTKVKDLSVLQDMPLLHLDLTDTQVDDLSAIEKVNLTWLSITGTRVANLRPIAKLPLQTLYCQNIRSPNYDALDGLGVEEIWIDDTDMQKLHILQELPNLRQVNGMPIKDFIKDLKERNQDRAPVRLPKRLRPPPR